MKNEIIDFLFLSQSNTMTVVLGSSIICIISAITGCFAFLRKRSLAGDAVSHSVLPGICLAFLISGEKSPIWLLLGAIFSGLLSLLLMEWLVKTKMARTDTAITLMLSVFFGSGIVMLTYIQHQGNAAQAGLDKYLFGKAASLTSEDLYLIVISATILLSTYLIFLRGFYVLSFDEDFAQVAGFPLTILRFLLSFSTVWTIAIGIQAAGVVMMSSLLIAPALAARFWTNSIKVLLLLAAIFGLISGDSGAFISYMAPSMPTGPWIVVSITFIAILSVLFAPKKGIIARWLVHRENRIKILEENILKLFFRIAENNNGKHQPQSLASILSYRDFNQTNLLKGLQKLKRKGFIKQTEDHYILTEEGAIMGRKIIRLHRLWELYLQKKLHLPPDHVHDDAEAVEHVITPEIEKLLDHELGFPEKDPHNTQIPPSK